MLPSELIKTRVDGQPPVVLTDLSFSGSLILDDDDDDDDDDHDSLTHIHTQNGCRDKENNICAGRGLLHRRSASNGAPRQRLRLLFRTAIPSGERLDTT